MNLHNHIYSLGSAKRNKAILVSCIGILYRQNHTHLSADVSGDSGNSLVLKL